MNTELLFRTDAYLRETQARVTAADDIGKSIAPDVDRRYTAPAMVLRLLSRP